MPDYEQKIKEIEEEIRKTAYNKATQHHIGLLKAKAARLRVQQESRGKSGKKGEGYSVRKTGDATVVLVGFPSVGKSTILNRITNAESKIGSYAFTTLTAVPGIMKYRHARVQLVDLPGLIKGAASGSGRGREVLSVIRSADLIIFIAEPYGINHVDVLKKELYNAGFRIDEKKPHIKIKKKDKGGVDIASTVKLTKIDRKTIESILRELSYNNASVVIRDDVSPDQLIDVIQGNRIYVKSFVIINKADTADKKQIQLVKKMLPRAHLASAEKDPPEKIKRAIFNNLKLMRIYMKETGKKADMDEPLIIKEGSTVADVCRKLHKNFLATFKNAKVWGSSAKFPGQILHEKHVLKDKDTLQINVR